MDYATQIEFRETDTNIIGCSFEDFRKSNFRHNFT